jgi:ribonuclease HI
MGQLLLAKERLEQEFIQIYFNKLGQQEKNGSNYDGGIKAIREALVKIKEMQIPKIVILSDSKTAIQSIVRGERRRGEVAPYFHLFLFIAMINTDGSMHNFKKMKIFNLWCSIIIFCDMLREIDWCLKCTFPPV